jgi:hypothetical protein
MLSENKIPLWLGRIIYFEFWPAWVLYFPAIFYGLSLAIRARSFTYFTSVNPSLPFGGFFGESKMAIINEIPPAYLPVTLYFEPDTLLNDIVVGMQKLQLNFPIICKPDLGERGYRVEKINDLGELSHYLETNFGGLIVQEFINFPFEFGVLYYRKPGQLKGKITSVVQKKFLTVKGDGINTVEYLLSQNLRARFQMPVLKLRWKDKLQQVLPKGEEVVLQPIGNHSKGTCFLNANSLINSDLEQVFDDIAYQIQGFNYGRFDLKVASISDLQLGRNIRILELNGVISEPAHIYDPSNKLTMAWRDIFSTMKVIYEIAQLNHKQGIKYASLSNTLKLALNHFNNLGNSSK